MNTAPSLSRRRLLQGAGALGLAALAGRRLPWLEGGPVRHEAYVWQRSWGPAVVEAVEGASADFSGLVALGAELDRGKPAHLVRFDAGALGRARLPVGLAVRVHSLPGDPGPREIEAVIGAARASLGRASAAGLAVGEVQLDFDCPASRLGAYRRMLLELKQSVAPPLIFTALPSWLKRPAFVALASAADGYVLQVHGLEPASRGPVALFDAAGARRAIDLAGVVGAPFRVALPTYAYRVAVDEQRRLAGVAAEDAPGGWGEGLEVRRVAAPAPAVAGLVRSLTGGRPRAMQGLLWYRLPVAGDRYNWSMATLRAVQRGAAPRGRLVIEAVADDEAWSIEARNEGDDDAELRRVELRWSEAGLVARDALRGLREEEPGPGRLVWEAERPLSLSPGERRALGWLRLDGRGKVVAYVDEQTAG